VLHALAAAAALAASLCGGTLARIDQAAGAGAPGSARQARVVMGTIVEIRASGTPSMQAALDQAFRVVDRVDASMSLWKESELTRLNQRGSGVLSADLASVLAHALDVAAASNGAFDPTVEPLVRAAGLVGGEPRALAADERRRLLQRVGFGRVHFDPVSRRVRLDRGTRLDLGGIAKGYAGDLALAVLREAGAQSALVDIGGSSIAVRGQRLVVEIRDPEKTGAPAWASFRATDVAVSSSGGDQKPRHILDPRTGLPATGVLAASVVAASGIEADALSTAVYVLGPVDGLRLLVRRGADGVVLLQQAGTRVLLATPGFAGRYGLVTAPGVELREVARPERR
jgi:thiamine biosynthesis lipoprotein